MAERRKKIAAFCLKTEAKNTKIEIFDACDWPDGESGFVRVRLDGKWVEGTGSARTYLNADAVSELVRRLLLEQRIMAPAPEKPTFSVGDVVGVEGPPFDEDGFGWGTQTARVLSAEPVFGHDSRWYVAVSVIGRGCRIVPADTLTTFPRG